MEAITLENFRCFESRTEIPIKKLSLLVGENSSGKTTILAGTRVAWHVLRGDAYINFNSEPFCLGGFRDIIHAKGKAKGTFIVGGKGPVPFFEMGRKPDKSHEVAESTMVFKEDDLGNPRPVSATLKFDGRTIELRLSAGEVGTNERSAGFLESITYCGPGGRGEFFWEVGCPLLPNFPYPEVGNCVPVRIPAPGFPAQPE